MISKGVITGLVIVLLGGFAYSIYRMNHPMDHLNELKINDLPGVSQEDGKLSHARTKTVITFDKMVHDFGAMKEGEEREYSFRFTNNGNEPLYIESAKGSCGCTVPMWPKEPIAPGSSGEIKVKFNSKNKKGNNQKKVTLLSNTDPVTTVLTITAQVE
jgi:hypothetical protein